jgi:hypothetical protein
VGKTTVPDELRRRGHLTVDTDYDGWKLPDGTWDERRMDRMLARHPDVIVSGTVENQGRFYDRFEHVVLLSATRSPLRLGEHAYEQPVWQNQTVAVPATAEFGRVIAHLARRQRDVRRECNGRRGHI